MKHTRLNELDFISFVMKTYYLSASESVSLILSDLLYERQLYNIFFFFKLYGFESFIWDWDLKEYLGE